MLNKQIEILMKYNKKCDSFLHGYRKQIQSMFLDKDSTVFQQVMQQEFPNDWTEVLQAVVGDSCDVNSLSKECRENIWWRLHLKKLEALGRHNISDPLLENLVGLIHRRYINLLCMCINQYNPNDETEDIRLKDEEWLKQQIDDELKKVK